jgi:hypothetical protein
VSPITACTELLFLTPIAFAVVAVATLVPLLPLTVAVAALVLLLVGVRCSVLHSRCAGASTTAAGAELSLPTPAAAASLLEELSAINPLLVSRLLLLLTLLTLLCRMPLCVLLLLLSLFAPYIPPYTLIAVALVQSVAAAAAAAVVLVHQNP